MSDEFPQGARNAIDQIKKWTADPAPLRAVNIDGAIVLFNPIDYEHDHRVISLNLLCEDMERLLAERNELAAAKLILLHAFDDTHDGSNVSKKTVLEVLAHIKEHGFR